MNERTNKEIEKYLKSNRWIRYDEIEKIMRVVDNLTEWAKEKTQKVKNEPPLRALFIKTINMPIWLISIISIVMFIIGRYS